MTIFTFYLVTGMASLMSFFITRLLGGRRTRIEALILSYLVTLGLMILLVPAAKEQAVLPWALTIASVVLGVTVGKWVNNRLPKFPF